MAAVTDRDFDTEGSLQIVDYIYIGITTNSSGSSWINLNKMHPDIFKGLLCLADINLSEFLLCQNDLASYWSKLSLSLACYRYIEWVMFLYFAATVKPTTWDRKVLPLKIVKSIWSWQTQKFKIGFDIILFSATKSG